MQLKERSLAIFDVCPLRLLGLWYHTPTVGYNQNTLNAFLSDISGIKDESHVKSIIMAMDYMKQVVQNRLISSYNGVNKETKRFLEVAYTPLEDPGTSGKTWNDWNKYSLLWILSDRLNWHFSCERKGNIIPLITSDIFIDSNLVQSGADRTSELYRSQVDWTGDLMSFLRDLQEMRTQPTVQDNLSNLDAATSLVTGIERIRVQRHSLKVEALFMQAALGLLAIVTVRVLLFYVVMFYVFNRIHLLIYSPERVYAMIGHLPVD